MDRLKYDGAVTVRYNQLSTLTEGKERKIVDMVSGKIVDCTVVFVYEKQDIESIPNWSPIDSLLRPS